MKQLTKIILQLTIICSLPFGKGWGWDAVAQHPEAKRATHWYFGNGAGLDFSSGSPVAVTNGQLDSWESCASISDINGNLLFYTDGDTVWDRTHTVMPNGTGLFGSCVPPGPNNSATQGVIIIPQPKSDSLFFIFTVDCAENLGARGMNYSMVDLSLNAGFGDVTLKNQFLFAPSTEGMAATMNCTRDSVWVVGHEYGTNAFYAYLVTKNGLNTTPVISNVGQSVNSYFHTITFSPNSKRLLSYVNIFDFNFITGVVHTPIPIPVTGYGFSFSPDSRKFYVSSSGNLILQFDATLNNAVDILNSVQYVYQGLSNDEYFGIRLGNDYKIYIAANDTTKISTIDFPNNNAPMTGFNPYSVDLNGRKSQFTFPSFIESYFDDTYTPCYTNNDTVQTGITISNVFTPNNDGFNDVFSIVLQGYEQINYHIFNRWGQMVKNGRLKVKNDGIAELWDGRTNADKKVPSGTYYYIINLTKKGGENETKKGFITLLH